MHRDLHFSKCTTPTSLKAKCNVVCPFHHPTLIKINFTLLFWRTVLDNKYHWISWNSHNYERSSFSSVATLHFLNNSFYSLPTYIPPTSIENIAYPHSPSPNKLKCILDTSINRIWISKTSIVTECWISRNSHQWSTRLATQRPLTPYQVSIITNQSKQSLDEFKQQWFSQACLTPLMRYWCLHSFFFIMEKEKKINSFTAVYHCSHRKSIRYSLWRPSNLIPCLWTSKAW